MKIAKGLSLAIGLLLVGTTARAQGSKAPEHQAKPAATVAVKQDSGKMGKMESKGSRKHSKKSMKKSGSATTKADSTAKGTKKPGK